MEDNNPEIPDVGKIDASRSVLPFSSIRVAAFDFDVEEWDRATGIEENKFGKFSSSDGIISVDMSKTKMVIDTILHEVFHAILWAYGQTTDDDTIREEVAANCLATGLIQVLRDNPRLQEFLNQHIERLRTGGTGTAMRKGGIT